MIGLRQRRNRSSSSLPLSPDRAKSRVLDRRRPGAIFAFVCLLLPRVLSALYNIIHDCDEVYNYWEPLHFLLYGHGMQTWEYSAAYALRSYLYLLVHTTIAGPAALWLGTGSGKVAVFYVLRAALAVTSAYAEARLVRAVRDFAGAKLAQLLLFLLCCSAGMFAAASAFLPSSFVMYTLTLAAAAVIDNHPRGVIAYGAIAVLLGWPVAGVAFVPYAIYVLTAAPFLSALGTAVTMSLLMLVPLVVTDRLFYGRWTVTLWNFLKYNVMGGGDSALYGVESTTFYLRNALTNLNLVLPLALLVPLSALFLMSNKRGAGVRIRLAIAVAPVWVWGAVISALPHKEERFLYPVYPLVCLSAAMTLAALPVMAKGTLGCLLPRQAVQWVARLAPRLACCAILALSLSRVAALLLNYGAPMQVYRQLPQAPLLQPGTNFSYVCVGDEWHRFPSSFHLPHPSYRLAFVKSDFHGLLPRPFETAQGGTAGAPEELNNRNQEEPRNYRADTSQCQYYVGRQPKGAEHIEGLEGWQAVAQWPFVEQSKSPRALYRAFYVPQISQRTNRVLNYVVLQRPEKKQRRSWLRQ